MLSTSNSLYYSDTHNTGIMYQISYNVATPYMHGVNTIGFKNS